MDPNTLVTTILSLSLGLVLSSCAYHYGVLVARRKAREAKAASVAAASNETVDELISPFSLESELAFTKKACESTTCKEFLDICMPRKKFSLCAKLEGTQLLVLRNTVKCVTVIGNNLCVETPGILVMTSRAVYFFSERPIRDMHVLIEDILYFTCFYNVITVTTRDGEKFTFKLHNDNVSQCIAQMHLFVDMAHNSRIEASQLGQLHLHQVNAKDELN